VHPHPPFIEPHTSPSGAGINLTPVAPVGACWLRHGRTHLEKATCAPHPLSLFSSMTTAYWFILPARRHRYLSLAQGGAQVAFLSGGCRHTA